MRRKLFSAVFLIVSLTVALGAFGHGSQWERHVHGSVTTDPQVMELLALVWYWVSGGMLVLGLLLLWTGWRILKGDRNLFFIPLVVAVFYCIEGVYGAVYLGTFFTIFIWQALLLLIASWGLWSTGKPAGER